MMRFVLLFCCCFLLVGPVRTQTILQAGDLLVVGMASNIGGDIGECPPEDGSQFQGRDRISFIAFRTITNGTVIDITDNGWERRTTGNWGNTEGFLRATRNGGDIPAGTLITFEFPAAGSGYTATTPDNQWSFESLGTNALNFNTTGDQLYFMQGGNWDNGTVLGCCNGEQDAQYTGGRILFAFNSAGDWTGLQDDSQNSALHPDLMDCYNLIPTGGPSSYAGYTGPMSETTQLGWIERVSDPGNWTAYPSCDAYQDPPAFFPLAPSGIAMDCTICQACAPFADTLIFILPIQNEPYSVQYSDGMDTFRLDGVRSGEGVPVQIDRSQPYAFISVADAAGCPIYSNLGSGVELMVASDPPMLSCTPLTAAPEGSVQLAVSGGISPFSLSWTNGRGISGSISGDGSASFVIRGLAAGGAYSAQVTGAGGCTDSCTFVLEGPACEPLMVDFEILPSGDCGVTRSIRIRSIERGTPPYSLRFEEDGSPIPIGALPFGIPGFTPGNYRLFLEDAAGCRSPLDFLVTPDPVAAGLSLDLGPDATIAAGQQLRLEPFINFDPVAVEWSPEQGVSDPRTLYTSLAPDRTTRYRVSAEAESGCVLTDSILVTVVEAGLIFVPNVFSPNEDGVNDYFNLYPRAEVRSIRSLVIFDRWGNIVYRAVPDAPGDLQGWHGLLPGGRPAMPGVYLYKIEAVDEDNAVFVQRGSVTLIR